MSSRPNIKSKFSCISDKKQIAIFDRYALIGGNYYSIENVGQKKKRKLSKIIKKKTLVKRHATKFYERAAFLKNQKAKDVTRVIKRKENLEEFIKNFSVRIKRIKRRTLLKIQLDKYFIRDCVNGLRAFFQSEKSDGGENRKSRFCFRYPNLVLTGQQNQLIPPHEAEMDTRFSVCRLALRFPAAAM